jgi:hypothetical protein
MRETPLIALSERLYRAMLILYPSAYRHEYGEWMVQVFRDVSRDRYRRQGRAGLAAWWCAALVDLSQTVIEQRRGSIMADVTRIRSKTATVTSIVLCLPIFVSYILAVMGLEPPFMHLLYIDSVRPTDLGRIVMLAMLGGLPAAFVINLLGMLTRANADRTRPFRLTPAYTITGVSVLFIVLMIFADCVRHELRPFLAPLGSASMLGQMGFLLGLLVLPTAFLLLPGFANARVGVRKAFQPTSINLIVGAVILLMILMLVSGFVLEAIACSSGVPNCD